ncbi:YggS family pyridoxal phosphate-dependent enzyme [Candidatus Erwinia haradaeae]|uniref:Pyridoxal phosphate homeostasis protein n=1 Tax=Candidatus Erwinia haradaeae TaxID=1922217 RepID=A0A803FUK3_9GAMM|nr:YggS family pyridoxal phosphate-dependent enzyme [Candidatus Erwinia haradaeae]VFP88861.1 Pyridoxal phosphate homeostasis protein [Candidatus Erwinia haradaeae]
MKSIKYNLQDIFNQITTIAQKCGRDPKEITLLAVSKNQSITVVKEAISAGQNCFGENYAQEGVDKIKILANPDLVWHFIGRVQSNKSCLVSKYFDWCHSVNCLGLAKRLNQQRSIDKGPLNILIQINISCENTKAGILLEDLPMLASQINNFPHLNLRGLMAIPKKSKDDYHQRIEYQRLKTAFDQLKNNYPSIDTLSLGMSGDMETAIVFGSTILRIGTAIFGQRN